MGTSIMVVLTLFIDFRNVKFSQKPLLFCLYKPTSIDLMCVTPLGSYFSPVNDSIDPIILIGLPSQLIISTYRLRINLT